MIRLTLVLALGAVAACAPTPDSNPDNSVPEQTIPGGPLPAPEPLRTDCYDSTVPPELAPDEIRLLPQC